jgi:aerobic-type carbon monoxide dehydrogenase small subunit (CoxS/CutS family)
MSSATGEKDTMSERDGTAEIEIRLQLNGAVRSAWCEPRKLLVDFIREDLGLTGTHAGCEHGICGACTILIDGQAARSCTTLAAQVDGAQITTVEGLAGDGPLHALQAAFHRHHALQCGFCTPGMLMTALDFLNTVSDPTEEQIRDAMSAAVCRCTGYRGIVRAVAEVAQAMAAQPNQASHPS